MQPARSWLWPFILVVMSLALLWLVPIPLGVPGEWVWDRLPFGDGMLLERLWGWFMAVCGAGVYLAFVWFGGTRVVSCSKTAAGAWLCGLVAVAFVWLGILQESVTPPIRTSKVAWVLYYPGSSGYFTLSQSEVQDVRAFLRTYEMRMVHGDVLHVGTHPPGLFLLYHSAVRLCQWSPTVRHLLQTTETASYRQAASIVHDLSGSSFRESDQAALWLVALLTQLCAVAAIVPLFALLRRSYCAESSWFTVALWPLVPALGVFLPKSDTLYPAVSLVFLWFWLEGWSRRSGVFCFVAGLVFLLGLFLSLAFLPVGLFAFLMVLPDLFSRDVPGGRTARAMSVATGSAAWGAAGFAAVCTLLWVWSDMNLIDVWWLNLKNHAGFYDQYDRTYWKWLLVNPAELALAVGMPLIVLIATGFSETFGELADTDSARRTTFCATMVVFGFLWISGKNMGEAARLWIVMMPCLVWLAAGGIDRLCRGGADSGRSRVSLLLVLVFQAIVCIGTVSRVDGFHLESLIAPLSR